MRRPFLTIFLLLILSPALPAVERDDNPTALEIFDAALTKFDDIRIGLRKWQYHQTLTTEQLDSAGNVIAKGTWKSIVRPGDPRPLEFTSEKMEGKLS